MQSLLILIGPTLTRLALLALPGFVIAAEPAASSYQVYLESADRSQSRNIARIDFTADGMAYSVFMNETGFGDYFLSMRPFRCMTDQANMLCHLPYPYTLERRIRRNDLTALEHEFLFIRRKPTDYGIDPWNGLYYRIEKKGDEYHGLAHEVDLNILAAPPDDDSLPLLEAEMEAGKVDKLWLPRLVIRPQ